MRPECSLVRGPAAHQLSAQVAAIAELCSWQGQRSHVQALWAPCCTGPGRCMKADYVKLIPRAYRPIV